MGNDEQYCKLPLPKHSSQARLPSTTVGKQRFLCRAILLRLGDLGPAGFGHTLSTPSQSSGNVDHGRAIGRLLSLSLCPASQLRLTSLPPKPPSALFLLSFNNNHCKTTTNNRNYKLPASPFISSRAASFFIPSLRFLIDLQVQRPAVVCPAKLLFASEAAASTSLNHFHLSDPSRTRSSLPFSTPFNCYRFASVRNRLHRPAEPLTTLCSPAARHATITR